MQKEFYWDNSATTQVSEGVAQKMLMTLTAEYGNPSSMHRKGVEAERILKDARGTVARALGGKEKEILFTSGGTEANNLALTGLYKATNRRGRHIVSTRIEHPSVLKTLEHLKTLGAEVDYVAPDKNGVVSPKAILDSVRPDTVLVSVMMVNNETGARMDSAEIGRQLKARHREILYHIDAVQAFGKLAVDVGALRADALSISAHKLHGPKGVGALYLREGVKCSPLLFGGGQEAGIRPGTENVAGIAGLAAAVREAAPGDFIERMLPFREQFIKGLAARGLTFEVNGSLEATVPYILNISFPGILSEVLLHALESRGVFVSAGSACSSKKKVYSPVLQAMGIPEANLASALRFSFSENSLKEDPEGGLDTLAEAVRDISQIMNRRKTWKR